MSKKQGREIIKSHLNNTPELPGVYRMMDSGNNIIYIGKAKNLKKRVSSYFTKNHDSGKTRVLVKRIADIKFIVVETETDALLLENNLIKNIKIQLKKFWLYSFQNM